MDNLYNKIAFLCENKVVDGKKGVSFYRLCKDIGIRQSVLTDLKNGRTLTLSTMTIDKLATYFNVSVDYLLGNEDIKKEPADPLVYMSANRQAAVYELFSEKIEELCDTESNVIARAGVKKDFFPRLKNISLSRIERADLDKVAAYLGISQELADLLSKEDEDSEFVKSIMSKINLIPKDKRKLVNDWLDTIVTR